MITRTGLGFYMYILGTLGHDARLIKLPWTTEVIGCGAFDGVGEKASASLVLCIATATFLSGVP
jgi:hypothetical protein